LRCKSKEKNQTAKLFDSNCANYDTILPSLTGLPIFCPSGAFY
jgi:hypothetical protein